MKTIALLAIAAALCGCTTLREEPLEQAWQVAHLADVALTLDGVNEPCIREGHFLTKRLIGSNPNSKEVIAWGVGGAVLHLAVSDWLMRNDYWVMHDIWQVVSITDTGIAIGKNVKARKKIKTMEGC